MIYIPNNDTSKQSIEFIEQVLISYISLKAEKVNLIEKSFGGEISFKHQDCLQGAFRELELLEAQISAVKYTLDYVKLMSKLK